MEASRRRNLRGSGCGNFCLLLGPKEVFKELIPFIIFNTLQYLYNIIIIMLIDHRDTTILQQHSGQNTHTHTHTISHLSIYTYLFL